MNAEFKAYGSARMRWVEAGEPGTFQEANHILTGTRLAHTTGYYCDDFQDATAIPAVFVTDKPDADPWRGSAEGETHYFAAVFGPYDEGCGVVDFEESYADPEEAARAAHSLAERFAESEREYQEIENARVDAQERLPEELAYFRRAHSRALGQDDAVGARTRAELRRRAHAAIKRIRELRDMYGDAS